MIERYVGSYEKFVVSGTSTRLTTQWIVRGVTFLSPAIFCNADKPSSITLAMASLNRRSGNGRAAGQSSCGTASGKY